ncbi:DUF3159 domain-containing protein [Stackebrandtia nassauensis]|uniref:DUF3159 domain-containing protein n=1 Tax=Stackebrandtia nassauensis (strain DSM 44728 / CIP 108903 / NRRL B-16338 / NBRC 102104 / LLR-40K-21) TaxID=446470 RepID=D3Q5C5_STANL|nr:DUF3159 domain-containing protein [Stackebrandtia nassauensis]ADD44174.1 hypothetical protein Snas_4529 [Stackebrandtia nassauensis DSM 44728]
MSEESRVRAGLVDDGGEPQPRPSAPRDDDDLPPMTEQVAQQLGGVRGLVESGIPVGVFVLINVIWEALYWAIGFAVGTAVAIAVLRLIRKESIRHAVNGLFGIALGAWLAWRSGDEGDFYWPGIIQGLAYAAVLMGSVAVRHPLVGWFWSIIAGGGKHAWREDRRLVRVFGWLTMLWGVVFLAKNLLRLWLRLGDMDTALGVVTLVGGYPVTGLLILISIAVVRKTHPGMTLKLKAS